MIVIETKNLGLRFLCVNSLNSLSIRVHAVSVSWSGQDARLTSMAGKMPAPRLKKTSILFIMIIVLVDKFVRGCLKIYGEV